MKKIINKVSYLLVAGMIAMANVGVLPNCFFGHYQPEVPKSLRR